MANKFDITMDSKTGYGYDLTRTSYDRHQEINAKVIGVLKHNNDFRKNLLERNIGKYNMLNTDEGIGYISNVYSNLSSKPFSFDRNGLLGYTHIGRYSSSLKGDDNKKYNQFHELINKRYDLNNEIRYYDNDSSSDSDTLKWNGKYNDYTEYLNDVFSLSLSPFGLLSEFFKENKLQNPTQEDMNTIQTVLNNFINYDDIKFAMEKSRVGTITPDPLMAFLGVVTTNPITGKDTSLGMISNQVYANTLHKGALFNSLRKTQYITPDVYENLGNKLNTISTIGSDFRISNETGRLEFDFSRNNGVISFDGKDGKDYFNSFGGVSQTEYSDSTNNNDFFRAKSLNYNYQARYNDFFKNYFYPYTPFNTYLKSFTLNRQHEYWNESQEKSNVSYNNENNFDLRDKTKNLFEQHKIRTLIGRYYENNEFDKKYDPTTLFETAVSDKFGISHGRNLLTKNARDYGVGNSDEYGYENPYCRVWTHNNQYKYFKNLIRPFKDDILDSIIEIDKLQEPLKRALLRTNDSLNHFKDNTTLNSNGYVNITPYNLSANSESIKKCMFSIENLAWKDFADNQRLPKEQQGPNGGRIMWFPPYGLKFDEQAGVNWNGNEFIGRGEKIFTYTNTERSGTLSFMLLVDNPSIVSEWKKYGQKENDIEEQEESLLRFFAGYEKLALNKKNGEDVFYEEKYIEETKVESIAYIPPTEDEFIEEKFIVYIYFPHNYSGIDDIGDDGDFETTLMYLTQIYDFEDNSTPIYTNNKSTPKYKWCYRVDEKYRTDNKHKIGNKNGLLPGNYKDMYQFRLNYSSPKDNDATHSLYEFKKNSEKILSEKSIRSIEVEVGVNSDEDNSGKLAKNRYNFASKFIRNNTKYTGYVDYKENNIELDKFDKENFSKLSCKKSRYAKIIININKPLASVYSLSLYKKPDEESTTKPDKEPTPLPLINPNRWSITKRTQKVKNVVKTTDHDPNILLNKSNEREYFDMLKSNNELAYTKLCEKIKYFNPAFHSITPEGFNSRLAFLHQCTRQGPTLGTSESSDGKGKKSAGNLAFGRPPVCVLRIGDFYNTKIIINSLSIQFNETTWDMNPEGIGVQPMFAEISISFNFLGGSDIGAPISKLQNAMTSNYYANQSVYDQRSDMGGYNGKKAIIKR